MKVRPWFSYAGVAAVCTYCLAVILGAALYPGYSHLADTISSLTNPSAPNLGLMNGLFCLYNLACIAFGVGWGLRAVSATARAAAILVALCGLLGLVMFFFPQDAPGTAVSAKGAVHIALAGAMSLLSMAGMLTRVLAERRVPALKGMSTYSFVSVAAVFLTGGLAAAGVAGTWPVAGLLERLTIGAYLQWLAVQALAAR